LNKGFDFGTRWFIQEYGIALKNKPVAEAFITGNGARHICVLPCENAEKFIESFNSYKR
jgi:hypothetical protein